MTSLNKDEQNKIMNEYLEKYKKETLNKVEGEKLTAFKRKTRGSFQY